MVTVAFVLPLFPPSVPATVLPASAPPESARATGDRDWTATTDFDADARDEPAAIAIAGGRVLSVATTSHRAGSEFDIVVRSQDAATGALLWTYTFDGETSATDDSPLVTLSPDGSRAYLLVRSQNATFTDRNPSGDFDVVLVAIDMSVGAALWRVTYNGGGFDNPGGLALAPDGAVVYTASQGTNLDRALDLSVVAWDAATGAKIWETRLDPTTEHPYNSGWIGPIAVAPDGTFLIVGGDSFHVYLAGNLLAFRIEAADGALAWRKKWVGPGDRDERATAVSISPNGATAVVAGTTGSSVGDSDPLLVAYDTATGAELWNRTDAQAGYAESTSRLVSDNDRAYALQWTRSTAFGPFDSRVRAIALGTGMEAWNDTIPGSGSSTAPAALTLESGVLTSVVNAPGTRILTHSPATGARLSDTAISSTASLGAALAGSSGAFLQRLLDASGEPDTGVARWVSPSLAWSSRFATRGSAYEDAAASALSADGSRFLVAGSSWPSPTGTDIVTAAYDAATGGALWQARYDRALSDVPSVVVADRVGSRTYVAGRSFSNGFEVNEQVILAYSATGVQEWSRTLAGSLSWPSPGSQLLVSPDGARVYFAGTGPDGLQLASLDTSTGTVSWQRNWGARYVDELLAAALSPDGTKIVVAEAIDGAWPARHTRIVAFDAATGTESWNTTWDGPGADDPTSIDVSATHAAISVTTGADGETDGTILALDLGTGALAWVTTLDSGFRDSVLDLAFSPGGGRLALSGTWNEVADWGQSEALAAVLNAADGALVWRRTHQPLAPSRFVRDHLGTHVAWSVDAQRVLAAGREGADVFAASYDADTGVGRSFVPYDGSGHEQAYWPDDDEVVGIALGPEGRSLYVGIQSTGDGTQRDLAAVRYHLGVPPSEPWRTSANRGPGGARITIAWAAPNSTGDDPLLGYRVYGGPVGEPSMFRGETTQLNFSDQNLAPNTTYEYRVTAFTDSGESDGSSLARATTHPLPSAPRSPRASTGPYGGQITVGWTLPENSGGLAIEGYVISRGESPDALAPVGSATSSDRSWADSGLAPSTRFYYAIAARTEAGVGPDSGVVSAMSPAAPSAPRNVAADRGPNRGEISLRWTAPASDGGVVLQAYHVYRGVSADALEEIAILASPSFSFVDAGLPDATTFFFAVTADNGIQGSPSAPISQRTPELPGAPPNAVAANGPSDGEITVQWLPATSGGTSIVRYEVWRGDSAASLAPYAEVEGTKRSFVDSAIARGEAKWYVVRAVNAVGEGPFSATVTAYAPTLPSEPRNVRSAPGTLPGDVRVTWSVPSSFGGIRLVGYNVYSSDGGPPELTATVGASATSFTDSLRTPFTPRYYWVSALNAVGEGPLAAGGCSNPAPWATIAQATGPCDRLVP